MSQDHMERIELSVVVYQDGDEWVAQCVEHDIAARAATPLNLPRAFERAVMSNICVNKELGRQMLDGIPAAPAVFREMFDGADIDMAPRAPTRKSALARFRLAEYAEAA